MKREEFYLPKQETKNQEADIINLSEICNEKEIKSGVVDFEYEGVALKLHWEHLEVRNDHSLSKFNFGVYAEEKILEFSFAYNKNKEKPEIVTDIHKNYEFKDEDKLRGIGLKLYGLMLDYFHELAMQDGKTYTHVVIRFPSFGVDSEMKRDVYWELMTKKWDEIFAKFLKDRGYVSDEKGKKWTKEYVPE